MLSETKIEEVKEKMRTNTALNIHDIEALTEDGAFLYAEDKAEIKGHEEG